MHEQYEFIFVCFIFSSHLFISIYIFSIGCSFTMSIHFGYPTPLIISLLQMFWFFGWFWMVLTAISFSHIFAAYDFDWWLRHSTEAICFSFQYELEMKNKMILQFIWLTCTNENHFDKYISRLCKSISPLKQLGFFFLFFKPNHKNIKQTVFLLLPSYLLFHCRGYFFI